MVRTQLQIDEKTYDALRVTAHKRRKSMSAVVREILQEHLGSEPEAHAKSISDFRFIGAGASGQRNISEHHDDALAEDFR